MTDDAKIKDEWLDYKDAAALMHRPAAYMRERHADGSYKYWPDIERWQPGGRGTRLYVRREHVEAWIERSRTPLPAPAPVKEQFSGIGYESILPELRRMGADRVIRSRGLERHLPENSIPTVGRKAKKAVRKTGR